MAKYQRVCIKWTFRGILTSIMLEFKPILHSHAGSIPLSAVLDIT